MELDTHEPGVVPNLNDLHALTLLVFTNERDDILRRVFARCRRRVLQCFDQLRVYLVSVAVSLPDLRRGAIKGAEARPLSALLEHRPTLSKAHGATLDRLVTLRTCK